MHLPTTHHDRRIAAAGACSALAVGLMLGGFMHPDLAGDDRPAGPQIILGKAAERSTGPFDPRPEMANYSAGVPDYVLGTDWKRAANWRPPAAAVAPPLPREVRDEEDQLPPPILARVAYADRDEPPPPRHRYPTLGYDDLPRHAPVGQYVDDADEEPGD
jgi:hypothetical protein